MMQRSCLKSVFYVKLIVIARKQLVLSVCSLATDVLLSTFSEKKIDLL